MKSIGIVLLFQSLPREMLELILLKSVVWIMSVKWMANVRDNESVSGSYNLYENSGQQNLDVCIHQFEIRVVSLDECEMPQKKSGSQTM